MNTRAPGQNFIRRNNAVDVPARDSVGLDVDFIVTKPGQLHQRVEVTGPGGLRVTAEHILMAIEAGGEAAVGAGGPELRRRLRPRGGLAVTMVAKRGNAEVGDGSRENRLGRGERLGADRDRRDQPRVRSH